MWLNIVANKLEFSQKKSHFPTLRVTLYLIYTHRKYLRSSMSNPLLVELSLRLSMIIRIPVICTSSEPFMQRQTVISP